MAKMGTYCKAYPVVRYRGFEGWSENLQNLRKEKTEIDGVKSEGSRELTDDSFFYLQENFVVTDGIFIDENVVFDSVTPEWIEFCKGTLEFEVPVYQTAQSNAAVSAE